MKKVELLAPAGNFACLKAAINNGANAVYLGGKNFSARAFANNFDENEIIEAVKYAHLRDVKVYVTLNTLLTEKEFNNAIKMVDFYYTNNVDALLIQDLGMYYYIKENYPDFEIHCSTQMHVHNLEGVKTAEKLGFKRVVLARESTLDFIREACKENIEIETFVHGAICVSYSGQCLMSSVSKNRSANKGMCAQCCRLQYELLDNNSNGIETKTKYILSPKDMCLLNDVPKLIEAGVSSFKIEGRLKSSAYVGFVTSLYRKAIDSYYNNQTYRINNADTEKLKVLFNRNFTDDYLFDKNDLFGQKTPNHLGIEIGDAYKYEDGFTFIKLTKNLNQFDGIRINEFGCIVNMLYKDGLLVNNGRPNDIVYIKTDKKYIGKVYKTLDYELENEINSIVDKRIAVDMNIHIIPNMNVLVEVSIGDEKFNYASEIVAQKAINSPLSQENVIKQFSRLNETPYKIGSIRVDTRDAFLSISDLNQIRRDVIEAFSDFRLNNFKRESIYSKVNYVTEKYDENSEIIINDDNAIVQNNIYYINYVINKDSQYSQSNNALISEIGGLLKDYNSKIAYYTLNCSNSYCYEFLKKLGYDFICLSSELDEMSINDLINAYKDRNSVAIKPYVLNKGNRVLMYVKANPFDEYVENINKIKLSDLNNTYILNKNHNITEILENKEVESINKQVFIIYNK